ncbi:MAG: hypothetical protein NVSMB62_05370 [Acidobacteriaceae bacterium]
MIEDSVSDSLREVSRRRFLQTASAAGVCCGLHGFASARVAEGVQKIAREQGKLVSLLEDGGFTESAWGWQFTSGASVVKGAGREDGGAIKVRAASSDYARFLVLGPVVGETYTLAGWVRTEGIVASDPDGGAYFAASQFEFQGRPTEFTVDGKQATEARYGNYTSTHGWQRFARSVKCLPTTAWFEVVVGIYRAEGTAWFSGLTFVLGTEGAQLEDTLSPRDAAALAHAHGLRRARRIRPRAAILQEHGLPVKGAATDPSRLAKLLAATHDVAMLSAAQMADWTQLNREHFDLLVLGYGETFPLVARETMLAFLGDGGDLLTTGGYGFQSPVIHEDGRWQFVSEMLRHTAGARNLLPALSDTGWKRTDPAACYLVGAVGRVTLPKHQWMQAAEWKFDLPASGEGKQFQFSARWRVIDVAAAPDGAASIGVEQLDKSGEPAYAARKSFGELRGTTEWRIVERLFYLVPDCVTLRVQIALRNASGTVEVSDARLEERPAQVRINTAFGWPEDSLTVKNTQLGVFDADYRLNRVAGLRTVPLEGAVAESEDLAVKGYAASGVVGMNYARWIPLLEAVDASGRRRGAAGALMHHHHGPFTRSTWAFFGVENRDVFAEASKVGLAAFSAAARALALKCYLHTVETNYATYRDGEGVRIRVLLSNFGLRVAVLKLRMTIRHSDVEAYRVVRDIAPRAGETRVVEEVWSVPRFEAEHYALRIDLLHGAQVVDSIETAFNVWKADTLAAGMPVEFRENYFQVEGKSVFLQGTDDYLHTFIDQDENAGTWLRDAQWCRDSAIDVYENLMGLRGPQHRPTETWWRWVDAMLLNTQRVGGIFFPGMLVFSNTAVSDADLEDQKAYVKAFAGRYGGAAGIMYYLNGDLELHDPNLPDLQRIYNDFLLTKYKTDDALRAAWRVSPPEGPLGTLAIHHGSGVWEDIRTLDDFQFRTYLVRRWLNAMHDSIREVDTQHPVTAEFYQSPVSGIDLLTALGKLELANFGYFNEKNEDYYRFPQTCRFLDQSMRGKGINVGEFGVKTHPAWNDTGYYIEARTEAVEQSYFLSLAHYGFALGASKIQNWCWKYPADLPFEWGINYPNEMVPRDVRAFYRNSGIFFRSLRPKYEGSETVVLLASDSRMGGQGHRIVEGQLNAIRLLMDENVRFGTLTDEFLDELPEGVKTIIYPLPYCPSEAILERLKKFVLDGGQLYISGDISYDSLRQRTQVNRLRDLCGVAFVSERYANIAYGNASVATRPGQGLWPVYDAAPSIVVRVEGARVLLEDVEGHPVVTEFERGKGRLVFSVDPVELHGDPRFHGYGHEFYRALVETFKIPAEDVQAERGTVHCFRVPSQDARQIKVLVNYGLEKREIMVVSAASSPVRLTLGSHLPGVVVSEVDKGVQAVESSGDVFEDGRPLLTTDLHVMALSFGREALAMARRVLLLPMGTGMLTLHTRRSFKNPVLLMGEIVGGKWQQYATRKLADSGRGLTVEVTAEFSLAMLLLCDDADRAGIVSQMEVWMQTPWKLEGDR